MHGGAFEEGISNQIGAILRKLGMTGMSDDETDTEKNVLPKVVRRRKLRWLSDDVSRLMEAIETYRPAVENSILFDPRGNKPLKRLWEPRTTDRLRLPVRGLPMNWYDSDFRRKLTPSERRNLAWQAREEVPDLVSSDIVIFGIERKLIN